MLRRTLWRTRLMSHATLAGLVLLLSWASVAFGEEVRSTAPASVSPHGWVALPGVSYAPENGLNVSAAAIHYWPAREGAVQQTRLKFSGALSLRGSGEINVDPDLWLFDGSWNVSITSKLSELERDFFGVGNDASDADRESYTATRLAFRTEVARRVLPSLFVAGVYDFRYQNISKSDPTGTVGLGLVPGAAGGLLSALGVELRYDSRDSTTFPTRGLNIESSPRVYSGLLGSDYQMLRWFTDSAAFFQVHPGHVVAVDSKVELRYGDVPFDFMSDAGGNRLLRGLLQGRYRDTHYAAAQVEYRFPVYWRIRGVAFAGVGEVANSLLDFGVSNLRTSVGAGLRFALRPKQGIYLRLDAAMAAGDTGMYLNLLEAF